MYDKKLEQNERLYIQLSCQIGYDDTRLSLQYLINHVKPYQSSLNRLNLTGPLPYKDLLKAENLFPNTISYHMKFLISR